MEKCDITISVPRVSRLLGFLSVSETATSILPLHRCPIRWSPDGITNATEKDLLCFHGAKTWQEHPDMQGIWPSCGENIAFPCQDRRRAIVFLQRI